ncbi:MAG: hypothetical protein H6727_17230 [Myxococcales bacterium]|nr:hypothetical protein [Myxococcales bacterium]
MNKPSLLWIEQTRLDALFEQVSPSHARANNSMLHLPYQEALLFDQEPPPNKPVSPPALSYAPSLPPPPFKTSTSIRQPTFNDATSEPSLEFELPSSTHQLSLSPQTPPAPLSLRSDDPMLIQRAEEIAARFMPFRSLKAPPPAYHPLHATTRLSSLEALSPREPVPVGYLTDLIDPVENLIDEEILWNLPEESNFTAPARLPLAPIAPLWMPPPAPERTPPIFLEADRLDKAFERFVEWLLPSTGAYLAFLCDEDGLPLASADASEEAMSWGPMLYQQIMAIRSAFPEQNQKHLAARAVCLQLDSQYALSLFWIQTPLGPMTLGLVRPDPIEDITLCPFLGALQETIARFA